MAKKEQKKRKALDDVIDRAMENLPEDDAAASETSVEHDGSAVERGKPVKLSRSEKKAAKSAVREKSKAQKEWEDSIVSNKRVKREENRRKWRRAMLALLVFAISVTSVVYVMLLFIDENNIRITASSNSQDKSITLSMDNAIWSPFLDALGPEHMRDVSYNKIYGREVIPTVEEALTFVNKENPFIGDRSGDNYIAFGFMLRNNSPDNGVVSLKYSMHLNSNHKGLEDAIRVLWAESFSQDSGEPLCKIYAAPSNNERLHQLSDNWGESAGTFIEKVAYPVGSDRPDFDLGAYETDEGVTDEIKQQNGFFNAERFISEDSVFQRENVILAPGEIMYVFVSVWIEGSDFDCVDSALGGYVTLGIEFEAS